MFALNVLIVILAQVLCALMSSCEEFFRDKGENYDKEQEDEKTPRKSWMKPDKSWRRDPIEESVLPEPPVVNLFF